MTNKSGLWWGDGYGYYHSEYHPYQCLSSDLSLREVSLRWWVSMGWVNIQQQIVPYVDVWNTTNTSGENNYDHRRSSFFSIMPTYRTVSTSCECASMAFMGQNNNLHYDVHVYERDSFGTGSWLQRKSSTYAFDAWEAHHCREGMVRYIFPWRTVAYRWVNMVIKGIAWLHNSFIPASDLGLLYIGKTPATSSRPREYPSPSLDFGETFTDISVSGQCDTLNLCRMYTWKGRRTIRMHTVPLLFLSRR